VATTRQFHIAEHGGSTLEPAVSLVHVYRRDDGDYVLTKAWRASVPGCSSAFAYLGVCRWWPGDRATQAELAASGQAKVSRSTFWACMGHRKSLLRVVRPAPRGDWARGDDQGAYT
jgi:hypothetical protein